MQRDVSVQRVGQSRRAARNDIGIAVNEVWLKSRKIVASEFILHGAEPSHCIDQVIVGAGRMVDAVAATTGSAPLQQRYVAGLSRRSGSTVMVGRSIVAREQIKAHAAIPFGTFLAPAILIAWFAQVSGF